MNLKCDFLVSKFDFKWVNLSGYAEGTFDESQREIDELNAVLRARTQVELYKC